MDVQTFSLSCSLNQALVIYLKHIWICLENPYAVLKKHDVLFSTFSIFLKYLIITLEFSKPYPNNALRKLKLN